MFKKVGKHEKPYIYPNCVQKLLLAQGWAKRTSSICWLCFGATLPHKSCLLGLNNNGMAFFSLIRSPDLNLIEHLWDNLDQRVRHRPIPPSNVIRLRQALIQEQNNISQTKINTLIRSVCQRYQGFW